jgi:hypothetical protein
MLATRFILVSCLAYSSALKVEAFSSETSADFNGTTQRYVPEDMTLHISYNLHKECAVYKCVGYMIYRPDLTLLIYLN